MLEWIIINERSLAMQWTEEAKEMLNTLLQAIPAMMRSLAESPMKEKAEEYAEENGAQTVERIHSIAGFIIATPFPMRKHLKGTLEKAGVTAEEYGKWLK